MTVNNGRWLNPRFFVALAGFTALLGFAAHATAPPPPMMLEQQICGATYVFVGTSSNVRFVTSHEPRCAGEPATQSNALTMCGEAEADISVSEVLFPSGWKPTKPIIYRFGGGFFSLASLSKDLESHTYLFHVIVDPNDKNAAFVTSAPWTFGRSVQFKDQIQTVLAGCTRH